MNREIARRVFARGYSLEVAQIFTPLSLAELQAIEEEVRAGELAAARKKALL